mmetsp:Transcript_67294/g.206095  ORF Transcript_67294/g.206095 Transcript_67294/m.206095 type:complete len:246 (+) Transcript_67294:154-891(+)
MPGYGTPLWRKSRYTRLLPSGDVKCWQKALAPASNISFWDTLKRCKRPLFFFKPPTSARAPSGPIELPLRSRNRRAWLAASMVAKLFAASGPSRLYCKLTCSSAGWARSGPSASSDAPRSPRRHAARHRDLTDLFFANPEQNSPSTPAASQMLLLRMTFSNESLAPMRPPIAFMPAVPMRARGMRSTFRFFPTWTPDVVLPVRPFMSHSAPSSPMLLSDRFSSSNVATASFCSSFSKMERIACAP